MSQTTQLLSAETGWVKQNSVAINHCDCLHLRHEQRVRAQVSVWPSCHDFGGLVLRNSLLLQHPLQHLFYRTRRHSVRVVRNPAVLWKFSGGEGLPEPGSPPSCMLARPVHQPACARVLIGPTEDDFGLPESVHDSALCGVPPLCDQKEVEHSVDVLLEHGGRVPVCQTPVRSAIEEDDSLRSSLWNVFVLRVLGPCQVVALCKSPLPIRLVGLLRERLDDSNSSSSDVLEPCVETDELVPCHEEDSMWSIGVVNLVEK
mmetsp:Transcript_56006/g.109634  ORF Transcript_56006/g.109634 Transcript_56006/m.109634 type:complete len:259 (-) Transcript_56006:471-1247(-)